MFKIFNPIYLGFICVLFMASCAKPTPKPRVDVQSRVEETLESMATATGKTIDELKATIIDMDALAKSLDGGEQQSAQSKEAQKLLEEIRSKVAKAEELTIAGKLTQQIKSKIANAMKQALTLSKQTGLIASLLSMEENKANPNAGNITKAETHLKTLFTQTKSIQSECDKIFTMRHIVEICKAIQNVRQKVHTGEIARNEALKILGYKTQEFGSFNDDRTNLCIREDIPEAK